MFFIAAPGVVAGLLPWLITHWHRLPLPRRIRRSRIGGVLLIIAGLAVLVQAFVRFALEGAGTPAPLAPTERLVVGGIYRHVRNPMYVAVLAIILGQALLFWQASLVVYAGAVGMAMFAFVTPLRGAASGASLRGSIRGLPERCARLAAAPHAVARQSSQARLGQ